MSNRNTDIVAYLKSVGQANANAIAQNACGMTKASGGLRQLLTEMVANGELVEDTSGRYVEYKVPVPAVVAVPLDADSQKVVDYLKKAAKATMNAIAQNVFNASKATNKIMALVESLVNTKAVTKDTSGRYVEYAVATGSASVAPAVTTIAPKAAATPTPAVKNAANVSGANPKKITQNQTPQSALKTKVLPGYSATALANGRIKIDGPNRQTIDIASDEYLIVINNNFSYAAKTPADVIAAIFDYGKEQGITTFVVKDAVSNKVIGNEKDVVLGESRILCLEIAKHNKAA